MTAGAIMEVNYLELNNQVPKEMNTFKTEGHQHKGSLEVHLRRGQDLQGMIIMAATISLKIPISEN
jgi:hypothetical protein